MTTTDATPAGGRKEQAINVLAVRGLSKAFAAPVLRQIDLTIGRREVHALLGANGAGKSTLAKIVSGLVAADAGSMTLNGRTYVPGNKAQAEKAGVQMVMQELSVIPTLSVAENLFFNRLPSKWGSIDYRTLLGNAKDVLSRVGLPDIDPSMPVGSLGVGRRQLIEIASAISRRCSLLILDEPTASLTDPQIDLLFAQIKRLRASGIGILYISHRMEEIRRIADTVTVLRDGVVAHVGAAKDISLSGIVRHMVGDRPETKHDRLEGERGEVALSVRQLSDGDRVRDVSFDVSRGEILGIAGLVGSGRTETLRAVFGAERATRGTINVYGGEEMDPFDSPQQAVAAGVGMIPEDRKEEGLLLTQPLRSNVVLGNYSGISGFAGRVALENERAVAEAFCTRLEVQCDSVEHRADQLSGGNQQKVIVARWLMKDCPILLLDEPTRGIDVGARATIHGILFDLAGKGKAVVVVSSDLHELMEICDRITVLSAGRSVKTFTKGEWTHALLLEAAFEGHGGGGVAGSGRGCE